MVVGASGAGWRDTVPGAILAVWLAGAALGLLRLAAGMARLAWVGARARPLPEMALDRRRRVRLLESRHTAMPVTWGLLRPKVLLPDGASRWPADRLRVVLAHEAAHIRRGDWAVQMVAEAVRAIHWCQPGGVEGLQPPAGRE